MKLKKILGITGLAVASTVALAACGAGGNKSAKDDKTLTVGIMTLDDTTEPLWDKVKELDVYKRQWQWDVSVKWPCVVGNWLIR